MKVTPAVAEKAFTGPDGRKYLFVASATIVVAEESPDALGHEYETGSFTTFLDGDQNKTERPISKDEAVLIPTIVEGADLTACLNDLSTRARAALDRLVTAASFKPGDEVTWMHTSKSGKSLNLSTRRGKIVSVIGVEAIVKYTNGKKARVPLKSLTPADQTDELTRTFSQGSNDKTGVQATVKFEYDYTDSVAQMNQDRAEDGEGPMTEGEVAAYVRSDLSEMDFRQTVGELPVSVVIDGKSVES